MVEPGVVEGLVAKLRWWADPFVNDPVSLQPRLRNPDGPEAADALLALKTEVEELRGALADAEDAIKHIIGAANEAPQFGPFDCIDNTGAYYQSADFEHALTKGRKFIQRRAILSGEDAA